MIGWPHIIGIVAFILAAYASGHSTGRADGIRTYHFADNAERKQLLLEVRGA